MAELVLIKIGDTAVPYLINLIETDDNRKYIAASLLESIRIPSLVKPLVSMLARMLTKNADWSCQIIT